MPNNLRIRLPFLRDPAIIPLLRAAVAQLDRVLGYEPRGRGFESCQPRHQFRGPSESKALSVRCSTVLRAAVAQLDRVLGYEPRGRGFESCQPRHFFGGLPTVEGPDSWSSTALRAAVAQLDRVLGYEPRGRGFESCQPRHFRRAFLREGPFSLSPLPARSHRADSIPDHIADAQTRTAARGRRHTRLRERSCVSSPAARARSASRRRDAHARRRRSNARA